MKMMMERWKGRVALVTGASVGIGAAVARVLVQHGMKVVGCARNVDKIEVKPILKRVFSAQRPSCSATGVSSLHEELLNQTPCPHTGFVSTSVSTV